MSAESTETATREGPKRSAIVPPAGPITQLGRYVLATIREVGEIAFFTSSMIGWLLRRRPSPNTIVPNFYEIGVSSVPVVAITGTFVGMILAVQTYNEFKMLKLENRLGSVINVSVVKEFGPVLAATMLAGRIGGAMAAEIGTMKVTEQIDALKCLGANPIHYLVVPRFLACVILIPLLTIMADFMGVIGGALVSIQVLNVDAYHYWKHSREYVGLWEIFTGLLKSVFFGAEIAVVSCYQGFQSQAGAEGVGRAATYAFVSSFVAILASNFLIVTLLRTVYEVIWPGFSKSLAG